MAWTSQQTRLLAAVILLGLLSTLGLHAQDNDELEYRMELGGGAGACFYLGDANKTPFAGLSGMGGVIVRRIFNPRMCIKGNLAMGHIRGNSNGYFIPTDPDSGTPEGGIPCEVSFSRGVIDLGAQFEMNFWGYGMSGGYKGHSRITPYALLGAGITIGMGGGGSTCGALNLPVGVGVKYKMRPRLNIGLEWTMRFSTSDNLDDPGGNTKLSHPYSVKSVGLKNKDCYSFTMVYVTYDISPKYRKCNNE